MLDDTSHRVATIVASFVKHVQLYQWIVSDDDLNDSICAQVAGFLEKERERQHISLNALAQRAGLSRQTVRFIEKQERNPTLLTLLRISSVLGLKAEDVVAEARRKSKRGGKK